MQYAIFCHHDEKEVIAWTREEAEAILAKRNAVTDRWAAAGRLKVSAALMPTTSAITIRAGNSKPTEGSATVILDGPFAEIKEQLLGFYVVESDDLAEVTALAKQILEGETGSLEIRPIALFNLPRPAP